MVRAFSFHDRVPRLETAATVRWWAGHLRSFIETPSISPWPAAHRAEVIKLFNAAKAQIKPKGIDAFERVGILELDQELSRLSAREYTIRMQLTPDPLLLRWLEMAFIGSAGIITLPPVGYSITKPGVVLVCAGTIKDPGVEKQLSF